ncbi:alpha/beta hydrolase [Pendulispora rubella]|uniref:Alpha/beta hydrolase n=1 Tax=Pendulispora rubella TaxID=2741070 RepID=A0ABZ2L7I9_9BACT
MLLFNLGGPGGPGLIAPALFPRLLPASVLDRFDLIGFDPRGIGRSTPVSCGLTEQQRQDFTKIIPYPAPDGDISDNVEYATAVADACGRTSRGLMPYITTANTARDMDAIRVALGERQISYLGYSYGTYLGAVYASLFPEKSGRMVLDSVIHPGRIWRDTLRAWGPAIEVRLKDFYRWAAARDDVYHLGATAEAVRQRYFQLVDKLDANPIPTSNGPLDGNLFREMNRGAMYSDASFPEMAEVYRSASESFTASVTLSPDARALFPEVPADNSPISTFAVFCDDAAWPRSVLRYQLDVAVDRVASPGSGGMSGNIWPCAAWPFAPRERPIPIGQRGPANVLLVQGLRDPATPHDGAEAMRTAFGHRARLVSVDAGGHAISYGLNRNDNHCADERVTAFLITGRLPDLDVSCAAESSSPAVQTMAAEPAVEGALRELRRRMRRGI